ncbi:uncharacterized protein CTRU02_211273 [Colletotrichum truncatum]|uniref:Uncharacterized protein n=1 Tax=Colletotrichum truncatum TaxID=5467 RepID=A0ACC3YRC2_COLTU|nr:uncharacterized protein CTRU02_02051 [Colletotrichum truncatum]KAF6799180.1 hypothetical protein CTRU02_02051 [Colletotrichum truncatum]
MPRKKRKYVPKVKGCYECSQRRIDCDGTKPSCTKCTTRGISCSGFGPTYKFLDGFSSRRKSSSAGNRSTQLKDALAQSSANPPFPLRHNRKQQAAIEQRESYDDWDEIYWAISASELDGSQQQLPLPDAIDVSWLAIPPNEDSVDSGGIEIQNEKFDEEAEEEIFSPSMMEVLDSEVSRRSLTPVDLSILEPWKEFLLTHFSEAIAPEMVVVDDCFNGWRHIILPMAWSSEMIMDSVLAVSAFHIAGRVAVQPVVDPGRLYARAINQLLKRKDLVNGDEEAKLLVVLAIVVLLVSVMVNGLPDFPIVFQMLESALNAMGGENVLVGGGEMGSFLLRQIHKMRVYAAPLLSLDAGVNAIMYHAQESFDCLYYYHNLYPDYCSTFDLIADLRQQAFKIYLHRVLADGSGDHSSEELIQTYQKSLDSFTEGSFGEHVLVWPTFIVALECHNREQQSFFERFLLRNYHRNKFMNILRALDLLRKVWNMNENEKNWPALIPGMRVFIM